MASPTRWTWVWVGEMVKDREALMCCWPWGRKESDTTELLNNNTWRVFLWWLSCKESACSAGATGDTRSIPESGRSPWGGPGNPLQYSCLDRGAWWVTVHRMAKSQIWLKRFNTHIHAYMGETQGNWTTCQNGQNSHHLQLQRKEDVQGINLRL